MDKLKKIVVPCGINIVLVSVLILLIFIGVAFSSTIVMKMFGFEFQSIKSLILFFIGVVVFGIPLDLITIALPNVLLLRNKVSIPSAKLLYIFLDTIATILVMSLLDSFMDSISIHILASIIIGFLLSLPCVNDIGKHKMLRE